MRIGSVRSAIGCVVLMMAGVLVSAGPAGASSDSVHPVLEAYARDYSVTVDQAERNLDRVAVLQAVMASIRKIEGVRLAGWGIDHGADLEAWVWLTGDDPPSAEAAQLADSHGDMIIRTGADHSLVELRGAQDRLDPVAIVSASGDPGTEARIADMVVFTGVDMRANSLEIGIDPPPSLPMSGRTRKSSGVSSDLVSDEEFQGEAEWLTGALRDHLGVGVTVIDGRGFAPLNKVVGGARSACTLGFAAERQESGYGVITAGHCNKQMRIHGIKIKHIVGWAGKRADAGFRKIPHGSGLTLADDVICDNNGALCDITGVAERKDMIGEYVCFTGGNSGVTCGEIVSITIMFGHQKCRDSQNQPVKCEPVIVKMKGRDHTSCAGDSGGPVFNKDGVAFGIVIAKAKVNRCSLSKVVDRDRTGSFLTAIREAEKFLKAKVLTEDPIAPDVPGHPTADTREGGILISWTESAGLGVSYEVDRRVPGQKFELITVTESLEYFDSVLDLPPGSAYYYRVRAANNVNLSSDYTSVVHAPPPTRTATGLTVSMRSAGVSFTWKALGSTVKGYEVYRRVAQKGYDYVKITETDTAEYFDQVAGLTPGVEYYYRVKAVGADGVVGGWGSGSNYVGVTVPATGGLQADLYSNGVTVSWDQPVGDVVSFKVYRRAAMPGEVYGEVAEREVPFFWDPVAGLTPGVEYYYRVKAVGADGVVGGWGSGSNYVGVTVPATGGLQADLYSDGVTVSWDQPVGDVVSFKVYRRAAIPGEVYGEVAEREVPFFWDPVAGLTPGVEYYYRVKAVGADGVVGGWGSGSNYVGVTVPATGGLQADLYSNGVTVSWDQPVGDVVSFKVYRRAAMPGEVYTEIIERKVLYGWNMSLWDLFLWNPYSFWDPFSGLTPGVEYYYRVKAVGADGVVGGWGSGSNYVSVRVPTA